MKTKMDGLSRSGVCVSLALGLLLAAPVLAIDGVGSAIQIPSGHSTTVETPEKGTIQATRLPKRDTKSALVCTSADAAPRLQNRFADGSCRSHTKEHQVQEVTAAADGTWTPKVDVNAMMVTGR